MKYFKTKYTSNNNRKKRNDNREKNITERKHHHQRQTKCKIVASGAATGVGVMSSYKSLSFVAMISVEQVGAVSEGRLLVMTGLLVADELSEAYDEVENFNKKQKR